MSDELLGIDIYKEYLEHYGMPRRSGRYPWGSGENPYQHGLDFISMYDELRSQGLSEKELAIALGCTTKGRDGIDIPSTKKLRVEVAKANEERRRYELARIHSLQADGLNNSQIAREMGWNSESSVRSRLAAEESGKLNATMATTNFLRDQINEKGIIEVGKGVEKSLQLGVSREKMDVAIDILKDEGYEVYTVNVPQLTNEGKYTKIQLLCPKGTEYNDLYETRTDANGKTYRALKFDQFNSIDNFVSYDNGESFKPSFIYPSSMDSNRLAINYAEQGGTEKDGLIEIRRGVNDLSLGESNYAQVRILVDGTHYLKGMAVYSDDLPEGIDVRFNTNKHEGTPMIGENKNNSVLKPIDTKNPDNPFGSLIKEHGGQSFYDDPNGKYTDPVTGKKQSLSLINKRAEEGDWNDWSDVLPAQFLSKQRKDLASKQLKLAVSERELELKEIEANINPTVRKKLLEDFAGECDTAAVHLEAASMPRQKYQVILPLTSIDDSEIYAPNYNDGEKVALIRFPHGGTFEIPILTVNNSNKEGIDIMSKTPADAVGINKNVANRLSGADFDGDTVMVIPVNERNRITSSKSLGLEDFDPSVKYQLPPDKKVSIDTQKQMGIVSNLITDMTIKGATSDELAKAVKHSMVVIDAAKHNYDWRQSEIDNDIDALKKKYQQRPDGGYGGASTLISRAKSPMRVDKRQGNPQVAEDGSLYYKPADEDKLHYTTGTIDIDGKAKSINIKTDKEGRNYYNEKNPDGKNERKYIDISQVRNLKVNTRTQESTQMAETKDARSLISTSNTVIENLYADYANAMKSLANKARKEAIDIKPDKVNPEAKKKYKKETESLISKLDIAERNAPKERKAQIIANARVKAIIDNNPDITKKEKQKIAQQELTKARIQVGAKRIPIDISDSEWDAILSGAISSSKLSRILLFADQDKWKAKTTPKTYTDLSSSKIAKIQSLQASGQYSIAEISEIMGVSTSTIRKYLKGGE